MPFFTTKNTIDVKKIVASASLYCQVHFNYLDSEKKSLQKTLEHILDSINAINPTGHSKEEMSSKEDESGGVNPSILFAGFRKQYAILCNTEFNQLAGFLRDIPNLKNHLDELEKEISKISTESTYISAQKKK